MDPKEEKALAQYAARFQRRKQKRVSSPPLAPQKSRSHPPARPTSNQPVRAYGRQLASRGKYGDCVTVTISTFQCPPALLLRATRSILNQTYKNLRLIVVADGDPKVAPLLESFEDPRLLVHVVHENRGQFFAHDVVARATPDPFFAIQDADDWADEARIENQVRLLTEHGGDIALTSVMNHRPGSRKPIPPSPHLRGSRKHALPPIGLHVGMYRTDALLAVGGYFCGIRIGFDTLAVLNLDHHGRSVFSSRVLYHRGVRANSMTNQRATGRDSPSREKARRELQLMYAKIRTHKTPAQTRALLSRRMPARMTAIRDQEIAKLGPTLQRQKKEIGGFAAIDTSSHVETLRIVLAASPKSPNGGIVRHMDLIARSLRSLGHQCRLSPIEETAKGLSNCDAVIYMGWFHDVPRGNSTGDGQRPHDWKMLRQTCTRARAISVPVIANGTWDDHPARVRWTVAALEEIQKIHSLFRFVAWSPSVFDDPHLAAIRDSFIVVPQPVCVRAARAAVERGFEDRAGICVGELGKLCISRYVGRDFDVPKAVGCIRELLPGVPLVGYQQYGTRATSVIPHVRADSPDSDRFHDWLARFRVFLSLTKYESFSRVPVEAQALGVPVVYRTMRQSLSTRIGLTGVPCFDERSAAQAVASIYDGRKSWEELHRAGRQLADAHSLRLTGVHWQNAIQQLRRKPT